MEAQNLLFFCKFSKKGERKPIYWTIPLVRRNCKAFSLLTFSLRECILSTDLILRISCSQIQLNSTSGWTVWQLGIKQYSRIQLTADWHANVLGKCGIVICEAYFDQVFRFFSKKWRKKQKYLSAKNADTESLCELRAVGDVRHLQKRKRR